MNITMLWFPWEKFVITMRKPQLSKLMTDESAHNTGQHAVPAPHSPRPRHRRCRRSCHTLRGGDRSRGRRGRWPGAAAQGVCNTQHARQGTRGWHTVEEENCQVWSLRNALCNEPNIRMVSEWSEHNFENAQRLSLPFLLISERFWKNLKGPVLTKERIRSSVQKRLGRQKVQNK